MHGPQTYVDVVWGRKVQGTLRSPIIRTVVKCINCTILKRTYHACVVWVIGLVLKKLTCEKAWSIRDWAVAQTRIRIKGHWATSKGNEVKNSCAEHILCYNIFLPFKYEKGQNFIVLHIYTITSFFPIRMKWLWELGAEQQHRQDLTSKVTGFQGHRVKISSCCTSPPYDQLTTSIFKGSDHYALSNSLDKKCDWRTYRPTDRRTYAVHSIQGEGEIIEFELVQWSGSWIIEC